MVVIRMRRAGSKNRPFFRIVVTESAAARDGRFIEIIGHYNPRTKPETLVLDRERLAHWMGTGAQPSDTLRTLISRAPKPVAADAAAPAAQ
jgi:small subunit ribosomal protein S16